MRMEVRRVASPRRSGSTPPYRPAPYDRRPPRATRTARPRAHSAGESTAVALSLEQAPHHLRHREHHVAMRDVGQHVFDQVFGEQRRALGLAARAEVAGLTTEREKMFAATTRTPDACEATLGTAAFEVLLDDAADDADAAVRSVARSALRTRGRTGRSGGRRADSATRARDDADGRCRAAMIPAHARGLGRGGRGCEGPAVVKGDQHVRRFDVPVNDPFLVCVLDRHAHLAEELQSLLVTDPLEFTVLEKRDPLHQLHHEIGTAARGAPSVEYPGDVGVVHPRERLPLRLEARDHLPGVHAELEDLQGDPPLHGLTLFGHVHLAEAAFSD
jgi:hypothetical protein